MILRTLQEADLPDLMALKAAAGWNQTEDEWRLFLRCEPGGCFGMEVDGRIVSSATAVCYEDRLAWIGMVLTLPEYRGRGLARHVLNAALDYASGRVREVRLDATDQGKPLYESLGFIAECTIERWRREPGPADGESAVTVPAVWDPSLDREVFGADRSTLLNALAEESASLDGGYAFGAMGSSAAFFGPCVADDSQVFETLLRWFVARHQHKPVLMDFFPDRNGAGEVAARLGFAPSRRLTRMVRQPAAPSLPDPRIRAITNFAWG